jgi:hypothetical protein
MRDVRSMPYRDVIAMRTVLAEEEAAHKRAQSKTRRR